ncbi:M17 family peptidase N-terminal domain-containing protein [Dyella mobilis]|uniref:Peptidase M17 n=1 Tax=Dyella mobilis TaxID=1849582 RepID=A0ABS2KF33_9GAMM|nr:M17 family peptidase N-terminal domain-containing protein [Dyella mobilis]MBM7128963.1 peptidase M17 [Dyella mobilis]GLQ99345.1 hypothetical protein GCM10007863_37650 [Dyella mobilis]
MRKQQTIGTWQGVSIECVAWDGAMADVDLSFACMFTHEMSSGLTGGLRHLDEALAGRLTRLRREGAFRGDLLETLLINQLPTTVAAKAVMLIGMGEPLVWTTTISARASAAAIRAATQRGVASAAFAPSLLDAGLSPKTTECAACSMMSAVMNAIDAQVHIASLGLAPEPTLRRWVFDVGEAHFDEVARQFEEAFASYRDEVV